jgi:hypothetical protein
VRQVKQILAGIGGVALLLGEETRRRDFETVTSFCTCALIV